MLKVAEPLVDTLVVLIELYLGQVKHHVNMAQDSALQNLAESLLEELLAELKVLEDRCAFISDDTARAQYGFHVCDTRATVEMMRARLVKVFDHQREAT